MRRHGRGHHARDRAAHEPRGGRGRRDRTHRASRRARRGDGRPGRRAGAMSPDGGPRPTGAKPAARRRRQGGARPIPSSPGPGGSSTPGPVWSSSCSRACSRSTACPRWKRVLDPTSELVLTILSQNSADINAEKAFDALRRAYPSDHAAAGSRRHRHRPGWGGGGWEQLPRARLDARRGRAHRRAGRRHPRRWPGQPEGTPHPGLAGAHPRGARRPLARVPRARWSRCAARDWLTSIDGIGVKTASVVLMMSFGMPLMPVDRHVDRVSKRIGLMPPKVSAEEAHDRYLALLEPEQCYPLHVGLITHGRRTVPRAGARLRHLPHRPALPLRRPPRSVARPGVGEAGGRRPCQHPPCPSPRQMSAGGAVSQTTSCRWRPPCAWPFARVHASACGMHRRCVMMRSEAGKRWCSPPGRAPWPHLA